MACIGIDFGTTNSLMVAFDKKIVNLLILIIEIINQLRLLLLFGIMIIKLQLEMKQEEKCIDSQIMRHIILKNLLN
jgi:hypothetical protein